MGFFGRTWGAPSGRRIRNPGRPSKGKTSASVEDGAGEDEDGGVIAGQARDHGPAPVTPSFLTSGCTRPVSSPDLGVASDFYEGNDVGFPGKDQTGRGRFADMKSRTLELLRHDHCPAETSFGEVRNLPRFRSHERDRKRREGMGARRAERAPGRVWMRAVHPEGPHWRYPCCPPKGPKLYIFQSVRTPGTGGEPSKGADASFKSGRIAKSPKGCRF